MERACGGAEGKTNAVSSNNHGTVESSSLEHPCRAVMAIKVLSSPNKCLNQGNNILEDQDLHSDEDSFLTAPNDLDPICEIEESEVVGHRMHSCASIRSSEQEEENFALVSMNVGSNSEPQIQKDEITAALLSLQKQLSFEDLDTNTSSAGVEKGGTNKPSDAENIISVEEPSKGTRASSKRKRKEKGISKPALEPVSEETVKKKGKRAKTSGVRRSTRIRTRPLQFWKGERFLYGRVDNSLVTVIGAKYASPSENKNESRFEVKSFVSDEHKHLVEFASL